MEEGTREGGDHEAHYTALGTAYVRVLGADGRCAPQVVQHRLGHESLATTSEVYGHLLLSAQQEAVEAIAWQSQKEISA